MLLHDERADLAARGHCKADGSIACFDLDDQRAEHVQAKRLPALPVLGITRHWRGDVVIDPVIGALVVVVGAAAANGERADVANGRHGHDRTPFKFWCSGCFGAFARCVSRCPRGSHEHYDGYRGEHGDDAEKHEAGAR